MMGYHVTEQACACGCGTLMGSTVVERGWKYLRGHKPKGNVAPKPRALSPSRPTVLTYDDLLKLLNTDAAETRKALEDAKRVVEEATVRRDVLEQRLSRLDQILNATRAILGRETFEAVA